MDQRLTEVFKKILTNPKAIEETCCVGSEYYFRFRGVAMSIFKAAKRDPKYGPYSFYIYPKWTATLPELAHLASLGNLDESDMEMISYNIGEYTLSLMDNENYFEAVFDLLRKVHTNVDIDDLFKKLLE